MLALNMKLAAAGLLVGPLTAPAGEPAFLSWASTTPMGWNFRDCCGAGVWKSNAIAKADYIAPGLMRICPASVP